MLLVLFFFEPFGDHFLESETHRTIPAHIFLFPLSLETLRPPSKLFWQNNNVTNTGTMSTFTSLLIHQKEPAAKWELNSLWRSYNHLNQCRKIVLLNSTPIYSEGSYKTRNRGELLYSGKEYLLIPKKKKTLQNIMVISEML